MHGLQGEPPTTIMGKSRGKPFLESASTGTGEGKQSLGATECNDFKRRKYSHHDSGGNCRHHHLIYLAESRVGALSLVKSYEKGQRIRVFRSSALDKSIRRRDGDGNLVEPKTASALYRYEGLYEIWDCVKSADDPAGQYMFFMELTVDPPGNEECDAAQQLQSMKSGEEMPANDLDGARALKTLSKDNNSSRGRLDMLASVAPCYFCYAEEEILRGRQ